MSDNAEQKLEAAMSERGIAGAATAERSQPDDMVLKFERADGVRCGVNFGKPISAPCTEDDFVAIAAEKMAEWFDRFDNDPQYRAAVQ